MGDSIKKYHEMKEENDLYWKSNSSNGSILRRYPGDIEVSFQSKTETPMIYESPDGGKTVKARPMKIPPKKDKYVQAVKEKFEERSQTGIKKYNITLERKDLDLQSWLNHLQEELMDATLYIERLKAELK